MAEAPADSGGGKDLPGDYYEHGRWHRGYFSIALDEVSKMIGRSRGLIDQLEDVRKALAQSELPSSALGTSHEARGLVNAWNAAISTRLADLRKITEHTESIPDRLTQSVGAYVDAEERNVKAGNGVVDELSSVHDAKRAAENQRKEDKALEDYLKDPDRHLWSNVLNFHEQGADPTHMK